MDGKQPVTAQAVRAAFGDSGDFVAREVRTAGCPVQLFFLDGLTAGNTISDFVVRPLSMALSGGSVAELLEEAKSGRIYTAGEKEYLTQCERAGTGVPIPPPLQKILVELCRDYQLTAYQKLFA